MNREIKFRGKRLSDGKWLYGDVVHTTKEFKPIVEILDWAQIDGENANIQVDPSTVGQYTGLKDKKGKEIYEGDVLREVETERDVVIEWDEWGYVYTHNGFGYVWPNHTENFVVIGNIHDNPQLLNQ